MIAVAPPPAVPLDHDYGADARVLATFLTIEYPGLRQQAAHTVLRLALRHAAMHELPQIREEAVNVCTEAIWEVAAREFEPHIIAHCATLAHLACRRFAQRQAAGNGGPYGRDALLAIGEAAAAVLP